MQTFFCIPIVLQSFMQLMCTGFFGLYLDIGRFPRQMYRALCLTIERHIHWCVLSDIKETDIK